MQDQLANRNDGTKLSRNLTILFQIQLTFSHFADLTHIILTHFQMRDFFAFKLDQIWEKSTNFQKFIHLTTNSIFFSSKFHILSNNSKHAQLKIAIRGEICLQRSDIMQHPLK